MTELDEAELAQILGEAMRVYSYALRTGGGYLTPFLPLLKDKTANVTVALRRGQLIVTVYAPPPAEWSLPREADWGIPPALEKAPIPGPQPVGEIIGETVTVKKRTRRPKNEEPEPE